MESHRDPLCDINRTSVYTLKRTPSPDTEDFHFEGNEKETTCTGARIEEAGSFNLRRP